MSAAKKKAPQSTHFETDVRRFGELLPDEKLRRLQQFAEQGTLTDEILAEEVDSTGMKLLAFGAAVAEAPEVLEGIPSNLNNRVREIIQRVKSSAPLLLEHPSIKSLARIFVDRAPREERPPLLPFDDVGGFSATVNHIDLDGELTPTLRVQVSFTNREALPILSLRLVDMAFLTNGFLESLGTALESALRLSQAKLLDEREIDGVRHYLDDLTEGVARVRSLVDELPNQTAPTASAK